MKRTATIRNQYNKMKPNEVCPCDDNMKLETPVKFKKCCMVKMHASEQSAKSLVYAARRIAKARKHLAASIQHDIDHPIILPDSCDDRTNRIILP